MQERHDGIRMPRFSRQTNLPLPFDSKESSPPEPPSQRGWCFVFGAAQPAQISESFETVTLVENIAQGQIRCPTEWRKALTVWERLTRGCFL